MGRKWYLAHMSQSSAIPVFTLYGETADFPDLIHVETISERSAKLNWTIKPHRHAEISQLFLIQDGHVAFNLDGKQVAVGPSECVYVPPQVVHASAFTPGTNGLVFSFPTRNLGSIGPAAQAVEQALMQPFKAATSQELALLTDALAYALDGTGAYRNQKVLGLANAVLAGLAECAVPGAEASGPGRVSRMERLAELVRQHMEDGWSVADYAAALSVSSGHLSRLCRGATGKGAQAHIEALVIDEACRFLAFTDLPVAEIGYRTGFHDPSYFSKRFRIARGVSPRNYRTRFAGDGRYVTAARA